ncbi:MAG: hypothetical protein AAF674_16790 [Pseudomonadota bacterium]
MPEDVARHQIGGNQPPSPVTETTMEFANKVGEFQTTLKHWKDAGVADDDAVGDLEDFLKGARELANLIDAKRVELKKPHDVAAQEVQDAFKPLLSAMADIGKAAKSIKAGYLQKKQRAAEEAERRRAAAAAEAEAKAQAERAAAESAGDLLGAAQAREREEKHAKATKVQAVRATVQGSGNKSGLRKVRRAVLTNPSLAGAYYRHHEKMAALLTELANADLRAAKGAEITIPGFEIQIEEKI